MTLNRFRVIVLAAGYLFSLVVFVLRPGGLRLSQGAAAGWAWPAASFGLPSAALAIVLLFRGLLHRDPLRANLERFSKTFELLLDVIVVLIIGVHLTLLAYLLSQRFWLGSVLVVLLGAAVAFAGNLLPKVRPNNAIGIRTPWTLENETIWRRTHRVGGYILAVIGLALMAVALFAFQMTWAVFLIGFLATIVGLPALSWFMARSSAAARKRAESDPSSNASPRPRPVPKG